MTIRIAEICKRCGVLFPPELSFGVYVKLFGQCRQCDFQTSGYKSYRKFRLDHKYAVRPKLVAQDMRLTDQHVPYEGEV